MTRREFIRSSTVSVLTSQMLVAVQGTDAQPVGGDQSPRSERFSPREILIGMYSMSRVDSFAPLLSRINGDAWKGEKMGELPQTDLISGARLVAVYDKDHAKAELAARLYSSVTLVANSPEAFLGQVDAVIVNDDGTMRHQDQARRYLEAGIPTWIDKPLSRDPAEAEQLFALADKHKTFLMSCSLLRYSPEAAEARKRLESIGALRTVHAYGPNELIYYGIHPTELCYAILGPGIARVQNIGERGRELVRMDYADGRRVVLEVCEKSAYSFQATFYGEKGWFAIEGKDMGAMARGLVTAFMESVRGGASAIARRETLEIIRVLAGAEKSRYLGGVVVEIERSSK